MDQQALRKIAKLARIHVTDEEATYYEGALKKILALEEKMLSLNTEGVEPLSHPLEVVQRLRNDEITEHNERELFQSIAPQTIAGLYLVPKVIE